MEEKKPDQIKRILLASFVAVGVALVILIWSSALLARESHGPSFYRATSQVGDSFYTTLTANAEIGTMIPTKSHKNEQTTPIPEQSITSTPTPTEEVDQVN